jgi:hypothetical protein
LPLVAQEANLYRCLRGGPAKFAVTLAVLPASLPSADTPLALEACIAARASASYP